MTNYTTAINIDNRLLDTRYALEVQTLKGNEYEVRSRIIALNRKYSVVRTALKDLYELGIQHSCNLTELLDNYNVIVGDKI